MTESEAVELCKAFDATGANVWIDGGWAVDALLGAQTCAHDDLDIALAEIDVAAVRSLLEARGFHDVPRDDTSRWNFVLGHADGRQVDFHVFVSNDQGEVIGGMPYPAASLTGEGRIGGRTVRCIEAGHLVRFHSGYAIREKDRLDVAALCEQFGIDPPAEYRG